MKQVKNVAFVIPSLGMGGAERVATALANEMADRGINVIFLLMDNDDIYYSVDERIKIIFVKYKNNKNVVTKNLSRIKKLRNLLKINSIDTVISFITSANFLAILATLNTKTKVYVSERSNPNISTKKIKFLRNLLYKFADGCVFQTIDALNCFPARIRKKSTIIENPIRTDLPLWKNAEHEESIVTACRLEKSKNIPMLIDAFMIVQKKYNSCKLIIYGDGPEKQNLESIMDSKNINNDVFFVGKNLNWHETAVKSTVFVLSSNYEGMSNSLLEALAMGMPVISTDHPIGGARAVIRNNENGILVPINDSEQMANAILKILGNKDFQNRLSKEAEKIKKYLNIACITDRWLEYIFK